MTKIYHYTANTRNADGKEITDIWQKIQDSGVLLPEMDTPIHNWRRDEYTCKDSSNVWFTSNPTEVPGGCVPFGTQIFSKRGIVVDHPTKGILHMDPYKHPADFDILTQHAVSNPLGQTGHVLKLKRFTFDADDIGAMPWRKHSTQYSAISSKRKAYVASNDIASIINGDRIEEQWIVRGTVDINKAIAVDYIDFDCSTDFLKQRDHVAWHEWAMSTWESLKNYPHIQKFMRKYAFKANGRHVQLT